MTAALKLAGAIDGFVDRIGRATAWLALGLALVMGANVLLRYGFSIGSIWMQELEWHILVPICLLGMSYALLHGEHVRVDVVFQYFSPRAKLMIEIATSVAGMLLAFVIFYLCIPYVWQSWSIGEGTANPGGIEFRYVVKSLLPIGFALLTLQFLSEVIKGCHRLREL